MVKQKVKKTDDKILHQLLTGKRGKQFAGKQVIVCSGEVVVVPQKRSEVDRLIMRLVKQYPKVTPTVTFVPKQATYILLTRTHGKTAVN